MDRIPFPERPDWRGKAAELGFAYHTFDGEPYWLESACYRFSLAEVEDRIEDPSGLLEQMCYDVVEHVLGQDYLLHRLAIPEHLWDTVARSWREGHKNLFGRFDLAYDGTGPAKLLEYNADTPTSLFEASVFQWLWLEDAIRAGHLPADADQYNSLHEALVDGWRRFGIGRHKVHFSCVRDVPEDYGNALYMMDCAAQAGLKTSFLFIDDIGLNQRGEFVDLAEEPIEFLYKLYPWEWLAAEEFGHYIPEAPTQWIEPPWKMILSNKGLLPILWELFPDHPNLLPAFFADDPRAASLDRAVTKPLLGREGANVDIRLGPGQPPAHSAAGPYGAEGSIVQAYHPLPCFDGRYPVVGAWIVAGRPAGMGIREDKSPITGNDALFLPHYLG